MQQTQTTVAQSSQVQVGGIHPKVAELDFERIKWKLANSPEAKMEPEQCELAEREYRRFLTLNIAFPEAILVPTELMDKFWHAHILDTVAYRRDCQELFGKFLDHSPYFGEYGDDDKEMMDDGFRDTLQLYKNTFGEDSPEAKELPARCRSKPCHVPEPCRCR